MPRMTTNNTSISVESNMVNFSATSSWVYFFCSSRYFLKSKNSCWIFSILLSSANIAAFLGGAAVGAAIGILFAPEKGEDTRHKIAEILRKKGIRLNRNEMENLVDEIAAELKGEANE